MRGKKTNNNNMSYKIKAVKESLAVLYAMKIPKPKWKSFRECVLFTASPNV